MRNMLQFVARLLCVAAFLCLGSGGICAQSNSWNVWNGTDKTQPAGWTEGKDKITISTAAELAWVAETVNNGTVTGSAGETGFEGCTITLDRDIDLKDFEWTPIGKNANPFKGSFDGNNKTIKNLKISNDKYTSFVESDGLFGMTYNATIEKLTVIISDQGISGAYITGGIAGSASDTNITNCCVLGGSITVNYNGSDDATVGGIAGYCSNSNISYCYVNVSCITAIKKSVGGSSGRSIAGGIVGNASGSSTIQKCLSFTTNIKVEAETGFVNDCKLAGIVGDDSSVSLSDNYLNNLCIFTSVTLNEQGNIVSTTTTAPTNANGVALTTENCKPEGSAFAGWADQGWTLAEGKLPKISANAPDIIFVIIDGTGTKSDPYHITSVADMEYIASQINSGAASFNGKEYYRLENDIDLAGKEWTPIGTMANRFKGTFDGKGYCISGLKINISSSERIYTGLFGFVSGGTIQNLGVSLHKDGIRVQTTNSVFCGGIAGAIEGESGGCIRNCYAVGVGSIESISNGQSIAGGIVGENSRPVSHCYTTVNVKSNSMAGGISGGSLTPSEISYSFATGTIEVTGNSYAGGIMGYRAVVSHCLALNKDIKGEGSNIYRIGSYNTLSNNYASPKTKIKGTPINQTQANHNDGSDNIDIGNYTTALTSNGGTEWSTAWELGDGSSLPKLKMVIDNNGTLSYTDWPIGSPQPTLKALDYLPIDKIANNGGGDGKNAPIEITNLDELEYLAIKVNAKKDLKAGSITITNSDGFKGYKFILSNNIDLSAGFWTPIGNSINPFSGSFDGNNKTITLGIKADANQAQAGLFGTIATGAKVEKVAVNVTSDGITSTATGAGAASNAGAIAAINNGTIDQCYVTGEGFVLSANGTNSYAGGIAGSNSGTISNCYNLIPVKVDEGATAYAGGIVGHNTGTVEKCFASGEVSTAEKTHATEEAAGGIVGFNDGASSTVVSNCVAVNSKVAVNAGTNAHRVIGTGGDVNDVNNFSHHEMSLVTKAADIYEPLEGTALTKDNANSNVGGCFNGWEATWNLDPIGTSLPRLQGFADGQHSLGIAPYLLYSVIINTVTNGTLTVTRPGSTGGSEEVANNAMVPYNTALTITATPASGYKRKTLTVNGGNFTSGNIHTVTDNVTVSATFEADPVDPDPIDPDPTPTPPQPTVYYTVTLPSVEGAATDPVAGDYKVESWSNFRFSLTLDSAYNQSVPVVTTDRGETLTPRQSDGAYILNQVRSDVEIYISGIVKNPDPVANEAIKATATKVWITNNHLHLQSPVDADAYIYTAAGNQQAICHLTAGQQETIQLPAGIYFIRIGNERFKIRL